MLAKFIENPLPSVLGGIIVIMLGFILTTTNARISDTNNKIDTLEAKMDDKIDKLEAKMDNKIDKLEAKMDDLEVNTDDINLKLTALIAALNKTSEVDAALAGVVTLADP